MRYPDPLTVQHFKVTGITPGTHQEILGVVADAVPGVGIGDMFVRIIYFSVKSFHINIKN